MAQYITPEQRAKVLSAIKDEGMSIPDAVHGNNAPHTLSPAYFTSVVSVSAAVRGYVPTDRACILANGASDLFERMPGAEHASNTDPIVWTNVGMGHLSGG